MHAQPLLKDALPAFIAIDIESTGTDTRLDRIVELCLMKVDGDLNVLEKYVQRFHPGMPIPPEATAVHGITDADVIDFPAFAMYAPKIQSMVENAMLIAYNGTKFDVPMLHWELRRAGQPGIPPDHPVIDPFYLYLQDSPRTLEAALQHYAGQKPEKVHSADEDCLSMLKILAAQKKSRGVELQQLKHEPEKAWLDHEHKFYTDDDGVVRFGFGKNKDAAVDQHLDYLQWMLRADFSDEVKQFANKHLMIATNKWFEPQ